MDNPTIAAHFKQLADLMELHGENPFKIKSYANAGRHLKSIELPLSEMDIPTLEEIPGVGKAIAEKIHTLVHSGKLPILQKYLDITPPGVVDMIGIKGLGPKKLAQLWKELHIQSLGELYYACLENRLTLLSGFGEKTQANIFQLVTFLLENSGQQLYANVERKWMAIYQNWQTQFGTTIQFETSGAFRRKENTLDKIELLCSSVALNDLKEKLASMEVEAMVVDETLKISIPNLVPIYIRFVEESEIFETLFINSADIAHQTFVTDRLNGAKIQDFKSEIQLYKAANLPFFPAECRHERTEIFSNSEFSFEKLIEEKDIRGVVHTHTLYSDGGTSVETLARHCQAKGYSYLVVSDHSKTAVYANGLNVNRVLEQHQEIDELNTKLDGFKIFKSIESDILSDGSLDYETDVLQKFDLVIASIHSQLNMDTEKATQRLIKAIENPYTNILGHLTGRLLLSRKGYQPEHKKIIDACAANGVAIELNANPHRLDIDWTWIPYCREKGVLISINPDAHNLSGVEHIKYGVIEARKAGLMTHECLNCLEADEFLMKLKSLKS